MGWGEVPEAGCNGLQLLARGHAGILGVRSEDRA